MDFTGAQMVLTLKIISLAVCYQDGLKDDEVKCAESKMLTGHVIQRGRSCNLFAACSQPDQQNCSHTTAVASRRS